MTVLNNRRPPEGDLQCMVGCCGGSKAGAIALHADEFPTQPYNYVLEPTGNEEASWQLFFAVSVACVSPLIFGWNVAFTSPTQITMEGDLQMGLPPPPDLVVFTPSTMKWYASLFNLGAMVGAFSGSWLSERYGRKNTLAFTAIPHMIAWAGTAYFLNPNILLGLRILSGWAVGIGSAVTPCYIGEVATTRLRGALGAANQLSITVGIFLVSLLGNYVFVSEFHGPTGDRENSQWRNLSAFACGMSGLLLFMSIMPESPSWLAKTGQLEAAHEHLTRLRSGSVTAEYQAIMMECSSSASLEATPANAYATGLIAAQPSIWVTYRSSFIVAFGLLLFQQLTGANAIMMYTTKICTQAHIDNAQLAALVVMGAQVVFTALSCVLVEKAGRKSLLLFATLCMMLAHGALSYYYMATSRGWLAPPWVAMAAITTFLFGFSLGMGPIPWVMLSEIFPTQVRGTASSYAIAVNWLASFMVCLNFEPLQNFIGSSSTFGLFAVMSFLAFVFTHAFVVETKGKSVEEVLMEMRGPRGANEVEMAPLILR